MNEPHRGYIDLQSLHYFDYNTDLHLATIRAFFSIGKFLSDPDMPVATAFESFQLGAGYPTEVAVWTRSFPMPTRKTGRALLNPKGAKVWRTDGPTDGRCIWEMHGVWGWDTAKNEAVVLRENYFINHPQDGHKVRSKALIFPHLFLNTFPSD